MRNRAEPGVRRSPIELTLLVFAIAAASGSAACRGETTGTARETGAGGANTGGANTGDANTGDANTGGANTGGANTGGANTGGANTGGANTGDANTGDANTGDAAGSCGTERIAADEATTLYTKYALALQPDLNPAVVFEAKELEVTGLWEGLQAQLFYVSGRSQDGTPWRDCTVLYRACRIFVPTGECSQVVEPIASAVVANGAFYFSWAWGSGVVRSQLGKLAPQGPELTRVVSAQYFNSSGGPSRLVLEPSGSDILVYRTNKVAFNAPPGSGASSIGKLEDAGDRVTIVDDSGRELDTTLP
jgi:hypothetical protein